MSNQFVFVLLTVITLSECHDIKQAFKTNEIIPAVISEAPEKLLEVKFIKSGKEVKLGNELTPTQVKDVPEVKYDADDGAYYTLILTDPDAPSRKNPVRREWHHWLVVNIPGNKVADGEVLTEYFGSAPPKGSGLHRYVILLFKQSGKLTFDEPRHGKTDSNRGNFSTEKFVKKHDLGKPLAGNFYQAQYDDYVPTAHKKLGL